MNSFKKASFITLMFIYAFISLYRISNVNGREITWDVLGYYLYLPAVFIYDDPMLDDPGWLEKLNEEKDLTGTLYMVSTNDEGEPMFFFLMGMSLFYLPFFLIANILATPLGFAADGFSLIYQYALVIGCIIYTLIGLFYFRKNLRHFFSEWITSLVLLIVVFGTNYIVHLTIKNLEPVTVLFMLVNIILWNTIKWHQSYQFKNLLSIGVGITLMGMTKPSEVMIVFLPLLWNVITWDDFKQKLALIWQKRLSFLMVIGLCVVVASPQILYWWFKTGHLIYDSYKNPGVGLDIFTPHIFDVLFSYRKGWLLYTPVMIFSIVGFVFMYRKNRPVFLAILVYSVISFWIIASWTEWWYGAGFSNRPMITLYPLLGITLGYFLQFLQRVKKRWSIPISLSIVFFIFLNQFQWWQARNYIIDLYRTNKAYYWATFLKTKVTAEDKELLMIYRDFSGVQVLTHPEKYKSTSLLDLSFDESEEILSKKYESTDGYYSMTSDQNYFPVIDEPYKQLSDQYYIWVKASIDIRFPDNFSGTLPCMVMHMARREGFYGYNATDIVPGKPGEWQHYEFEFLTPELRARSDRFKCYVWKRGEIGFDIDNFKVSKLELKSDME
ncbi:MAG: hypothetical protein ACERKD_19060 [Prolixibacteraceae bacterium]